MKPAACSVYSDGGEQPRRIASPNGKAKVPVECLFGIPVAAVRLADVLDLVHDAVLRRGHLHIGVVNAAKIVNMARDGSLRNDVLSSHIILADGASVILASWMLRRPLPERVAGIDLMHGILQRGRHHRYRVFCLGADEGVLHVAVERIRRDYPGVQIVGFHHGYFGPHEEESVARRIWEAQPDILFVAMSSPKKENVLARWSAQLGVPVSHGVGGAFDVLAGKVHRAPKLWQKFGLEWLYRLKQEPARLWRRYLVSNLLFCRMLLVEMVRPSPRPGQT